MCHFHLYFWKHSCEEGIIRKGVQLQKAYFSGLLEAGCFWKFLCTHWHQTCLERRKSLCLCQRGGRRKQQKGQQEAQGQVRWKQGCTSGGQQHHNRKKGKETALTWGLNFELDCPCYQKSLGWIKKLRLDLTKFLLWSETRQLSNKADVMVNFRWPLAWVKGIQVTSKTLFLGVSMQVFPGGIGIWIHELNLN